MFNASNFSVSTQWHRFAETTEFGPFLDSLTKLRSRGQHKRSDIGSSHLDHSDRYRYYWFSKLLVLETAGVRTHGMIDRWQETVG